MADEQYKVHFFYRQVWVTPTNPVGHLTKAVNKAGAEWWTRLELGNQSKFIGHARETFASVRGSENVKNVVEISDWHPQGDLLVGPWWRSGGPLLEKYYEQRGWEMEDVGMGEGRPNRLEFLG